MNKQDLYYFTVLSGVTIEKNKVILSTIRSLAGPRYQVWSERYGKTVTEAFKEVDPAVSLFIKLSE